MLAKRVNRAVKKTNLQIRRIRESLRKASHGQQNPRGILVCQFIHFIFIVGTTVGALPFTVERVDKKYRKITPVVGAKKWLATGIQALIILRGVAYVLLPMSTKVKLSVGGMLTADCLIWAVSLAIAAVPAMACVMLMRSPRDIASVYNGFMEILRYASKKHLKGKHAFEMVEIHWAVVWLMAATSITAILIPVVAFGLTISGKDSPISMSYFISGPYADIQDGDILRIVAYWACALLNWLYINYIGWLMIIIMALLGEGAVGAAIVFQIISSHDSRKIRWKAKLKFHAQFEYLINTVNEVSGLMMPIVVLAALILSVCSILVLTKMDLEMGFPPVYMIPIYVCLEVGSTIGACIFLKSAEVLRAISTGYLAAIEEEITAYATLKVRQGSEVDYVPLGRTFRRRPIGVRMGNFMLMEDGLSISYLMQVLDNVVNYHFMVDLRSHPVWLLAKL